MSQKLSSFLSFLFFFNRNCNPCGFWPAQLPLSILSRKVFTQYRCQRHVKPQPGGPVIRTFQLPPLGVPHAWNDASEPQRRKVELWARNFREFCRKRRLPRHFWFLLHAVNLRHGTDGFTSPPKEGVLRIFFARKIRRLRPGLNPRTRVPEASTLTSRPRKPLRFCRYPPKSFHITSHTLPHSLSSPLLSLAKVSGAHCSISHRSHKKV